MTMPAYGLGELQRYYQTGKKMEYLFFWGHQPAADGKITASCLSQWWMADFVENGEPYCCMEQYMMAQKAHLFGDDAVLEEIMQSRLPKQIKALGRKVQGFDSDVWDAYKYGIVLNGNLQKFAQNADLKAYLLSTGNAILVEASPYDDVWGIKMSADLAGNPLEWRGQNLLGFALMEVRVMLKSIN